MFQSIFDDLKRELKVGNVVSRLIIINLIIFVMINLVGLVLKFSNGGAPSELYQQIVNFFSISSSLKHNLTHPWTFITSMFLHLDFFHILWNMLFLYWFGRIVGDLLGDHRVFPLYLIGGIIGGLVFWGTMNLPMFGDSVKYALGASAGIMAIVTAAGAVAPDYNINLLIIGSVKLKYIVMTLILLDLIALGGFSNTGGHFAHLGGAFAGLFYVHQLRAGNDWAEGVNNIIDKILAFFRSDSQSYKAPKKEKVVIGTMKKVTDRKVDDFQEKLDQILEKIHKYGMDSLTEDEKRFLSEASEN